MFQTLLRNACISYVRSLICNDLCTWRESPAVCQNKRVLGLPQKQTGLGALMRLFCPLRRCFPFREVRAGAVTSRSLWLWSSGRFRFFDHFRMKEEKLPSDHGIFYPFSSDKAEKGTAPLTLGSKKTWKLIIQYNEEMLVLFLSRTPKVSCRKGDTDPARMPFFPPIGLPEELSQRPPHSHSPGEAMGVGRSAHNRLW